MKSFSLSTHTFYTLAIVAGFFIFCERSLFAQVSEDSFESSAWTSQSPRFQTNISSPTNQTYFTYSIYRTDPSLVRRSDPRLNTLRKNSPSQSFFTNSAREKSSLAAQKSPLTDQRRYIETIQQKNQKTKIITIAVALVAVALGVFLLSHSNLVYQRTLHHTLNSQIKKMEPPSPAPMEIAPIAIIPRAPFPQLAATPSCPIDQLTKLKTMLDQDLISQEDYERKKKDILSKI